MTRTDRDKIVPRVPAPRLAPDDWFVHQLSQLATASTPSASGLGARTRRVTVIAIASAVLLAGGAYAAERVLGSSVPPGNHEPGPTDLPTDRTSPTPDVTPAEPAGTAPARPTVDPSGAPGTGVQSNTDQSESDGGDVRSGSRPQSDEATEPTDEDTKHTEDTEDPPHTEDTEDTEDTEHLSSERETESDDAEETPSESPSPDLDHDLEDLLSTDEAAAPAALEDN